MLTLEDRSAGADDGACAFFDFADAAERIARTTGSMVAFGHTPRHVAVEGLARFLVDLTERGAPKGSLEAIFRLLIELNAPQPAMHLAERN